MDLSNSAPGRVCEVAEGFIWDVQWGSGSLGKIGGMSLSSMWSNSMVARHYPNINGGGHKIQPSRKICLKIFGDERFHLRRDRGRCRLKEKER
jgi:hypothetical protein